MKIATDGPKAGSKIDAIVKDAICGCCESHCGFSQVAGVDAPLFSVPTQHAFGTPRLASSAPVLTQPLKRSHADELVPVSWDQALREFTGRVKEIQWRYGKEAAAVVVPGQLSIEELVLAKFLTRAGLGMNWGGIEAAAGLIATFESYQRAYGNFAPPYSLEDLEESDVIVLLGMNPASAHPEMWKRIMRNPHAPELIVIGHQADETSLKASQFLKVFPGTERILLKGLARLLLDSGQLDLKPLQSQLECVTEYIDSLADSDLNTVSTITGVPIREIELLAQTLLDRPRVTYWWSTEDLTAEQSGLPSAAVNLSLLSGSAGRPGSGANALLVPCHILGSVMTEMVEELGPESACTEPQILESLPAFHWNVIREGILNDRIKALWIIATNASAGRLRETFPSELIEKLEFLVVQDLSGEPVSLPEADLYLPAAAWGEKCGTLMTSERRVHLIPERQSPRDQSLSDFQIFREIARYWGCASQLHDWDTPAAVFKSFADATRGTGMDLSGLTHADLQTESGVQWPVPHRTIPGSRHKWLYESGTFATPNGRPRLIAD
ncbi:molybdopterin-dependent oxidoreductase [Planctomicrobium sp. SH661]|uniref:molybdopterin-dependent oxidoreductase n=1 Tax=Planctomicrobium sp. SH661 TaxID=3448124 RepID=UPI003F5C51F0